MNAIPTEGINLMDSLVSIFPELIKNKEQQKEIDHVLNTVYGIPNGTINEILSNNDKLLQLSETEICVLSLVIFEVTKIEDIAPANFFNTKEINKALKYRFNRSRPSYPLVLNKVSSSPDKSEFSVCLTYQEVAAYYTEKIWTYNFNAQRLSKKKMLKSGKLSEKIDIKRKSVNEIKKLMESGKYKADALLLNVLVNGNDNIEYDEDEMTLTINEGTTINLIDGFHRTTAIIELVEENPDIEGYMWVIIKHYPLGDSQFMLGQVNKRNAFDKTLIKHYMGEDYSAQITKELMFIPELKNRISIKTTIDKKLNYFTNYAILSESIEAIFNPQNGKERYDDAEVLKKFFGYLIPSYSDQFIKNHKEVSKTSWFTHHNTFVVFVVIAHALYKKYGKDFPVDEITRVVDSLDFSKENSEYNDLMTTQGKVNSNQVKAKIRKFAEEKSSALLG